MCQFAENASPGLTVANAFGTKHAKLFRTIASSTRVGTGEAGCRARLPITDPPTLRWSQTGATLRLPRMSARFDAPCPPAGALSRDQRGSRTHEGIEHDSLATGAVLDGVCH